MNRFQEVTAELEQALSGISFENLDISDEVKEQVRYCPSDYNVFCFINSTAQLGDHLTTALLLSDALKCYFNLHRYL